MPYIGLLPFLQRTRFTPNMYLCVSMPYIGLLPFLHDEPEDEPTATACVNALHRASPISTRCQSDGVFVTVPVSMPYIGLLPFLHSSQKGKVTINRLCQCPTSGFSHFYTGVHHQNQQLHGCVNALHRASPISTSRDDERNDNGKGCQCPTSGFSHFYSTL